MRGTRASQDDAERKKRQEESLAGEVAEGKEGEEDK